jgi:hypothetical protein
MREDRRGYGWLILPFGTPEVYGTVRTAERLHWTRAEAQEEAAAVAEQMNIGPITWETIDDDRTIGKAEMYSIQIGSVLLPPPRYKVDRRKQNKS